LLHLLHITMMMSKLKKSVFGKNVITSDGEENNDYEILYEKYQNLSNELKNTEKERDDTIAELKDLTERHEELVKAIGIKKILN
jgi:hypothetical protein